MPRELPQQNYRVQSTFITPQNPRQGVAVGDWTLIFLPIALSFPTWTSSGLPTPPAWAKTEQHHRAQSREGTQFPFLLQLQAAVLFGFNCPDPFPWILFSSCSTPSPESSSLWMHYRDPFHLSQADTKEIRKPLTKTQKNLMDSFSKEVGISTGEAADPLTTPF